MEKTTAVTVLYFAWVREKIGLDRERVELPSHVRSVQDLMTFLASRSLGHQAAFNNPQNIRVAINQHVAEPDAPVGQGDEIALFPPVTGG